ncbi:queuosine 5'-phosphate N-glycosylase/hydrolase-like [Ambystoma mexicanum]|uniref:queuosine 5'-phosphate N-glycosylase/hydrolase-like n=1 Tax=Ambystoma mexicanum TaxID=8296 RepID=UPI0037E963C9
MESPLSPRESGKFIAEHSKDVFIDQDGVGKFATTLVDKVSQNQFSVAGWKSLHELNPRAMDEEAVNWVFLTDTLNFSFWAENNKHKCLVSYKGKTYSGFWALCAAVNRALDEGIPITSASYYATITLDQLRHVMRSDTNIPMPLMEERLRVLHETGNIMIEKFGGSYLNCVKKSEKSALRLMQMVVENFPSYRDEGTFEGRRVTFYKRVQILVADTWTVLEGKGDGCFSDISEVTMFADYRIPQALVHLRTMRYSEELMKKLKEGLLFQYGDRQEMEIRGCSIWCVELICDRVRAIFKQKGLTMKEEINAILLDHYLWDYARDHREEMKEIPFHHVRCIYY